MSRKTPILDADGDSALADQPLVALVTLARRENTTRGMVQNACRALGITPYRTASKRDHLSFNQALRVVEHLRTRLPV